MSELRNLRLTTMLGLILALAAGRPVSAQQICYVKGSNTCDCLTPPCACDGTSWDNAFRTLQDALDATNPVCEQIWVAEGTYVPTSPVVSEKPRVVTFVLKDNLAIYGGFSGESGTEGDLALRNVERYVTVLSGDINGDDDSGGDNSDNSYHVVSAIGTSSTAVLDGFTITGGYAGGVGASGGLVNLHDRGAGLLIQNGEPVIRNCIFRDNQAASYGGGISISESANPPLIEDCVFENNSAGVEGGSIHVAGCGSAAACVDNDECTVAECTASGCSFPNKVYGDVNGDGGAVEIFDLLCVLDAFGGDFSTCTLNNTDIHPCSNDNPPGPDGEVNIFDVIAVQNAFGGVDPCGCPQPKVAYSGGSAKNKQWKPSRKAKYVGSNLRLHLVPRANEVVRGETSVFDVFAEQVGNFRGYQLQLRVEAGTLVNAYVDTNHSNFVFRNRDFRHKVDLRSYRLTAVLMSGSVSRAGRQYLASFVVRAQSKTGPPVRVSLEENDGMLLVDPIGRLHNTPAPDTAEVTVR